jgi:hypothetical protein
MNRLKSHNEGNNPYISKLKPWRIKAAIAFTDRQKHLILKHTLKVLPGDPLRKNGYKMTS